MSSKKNPPPAIIEPTWARSEDRCAKSPATSPLVAVVKQPPVVVNKQCSRHRLIHPRLSEEHPVAWTSRKSKFASEISSPLQPTRTSSWIASRPLNSNPRHSTPPLLSSNISPAPLSSASSTSSITQFYLPAPGGHILDVSPSILPNPTAPAPGGHVLDVSPSISPNPTATAPGGHFLDISSSAPPNRLPQPLAATSSTFHPLAHPTDCPSTWRPRPRRLILYLTQPDCPSPWRPRPRRFIL